MSHVKYSDPATTRIRPGTRIRYLAKFATRPTSSCHAFGIRTIADVILGKYAQKPLKPGANRQSQAKKRKF